MQPAIKILGLICLGIALNKLSINALMWSFALIVVALVHWRVATWPKMLWRMRWLFLSMWLVYAFATPGEYVRDMPTDIGMTYEGIRAGALQITRLATMLGGIALLMATTSRNDLIAGFYLLLKPLKIFKLKPERFAARLCLTLQYLEDAEFVRQQNKKNKTQAGKHEKLWTQLLNMHSTQTGASKMQIIELEAPAFSYVDFIGLAGILIAATMIWL